MRADAESEVVSILKDAGYWDDPAVWRLFGDAANNFSTIGNQQSEAIAALVEKIVNGVDARLINACISKGIDPESPLAPQSIREAVATFFEGREYFRPDRDGRIADWDNKRTTAEGRLLTLAATGYKSGHGLPCLTIADQGEGQTPDSFPETFLSLLKDNKLRIHFVQGKYNMGGTGALNYCSQRHRLQLIVSRRNPALLPDGAPDRDREWGFTVVRRQGGSSVRSSVYTYLAPVGDTAHQRGDVLSFAASSWPIFPDDPREPNQGADAYVRGAPHGTLVKLYEYEWQGVKSNIVQSGEGLLRRVDLALPELALPVRLYECRRFDGGLASFSTNARGLVARLDRDRASSLEPNFPVGAGITLEGKQIPIRVYAFREGKAKQYRLRNYGVVFSVNGQMHAAFPTDFFGRTAVNLGYLSDSLLVVLDCSNIDERMREDLFMNSRDRLRHTPMATRLEQQLERYLKAEPSLRDLQSRRRAEQTAERLKDDKPLADVLQGLLQRNPLLSKLFKHGLRLSAPFPPSTGSSPGRSAEFNGKEFPTYFRFKGLATGEVLKRDASLDTRVRVAFETDVVDDYFIRENSPGAWRVRQRIDDRLLEVPDWSWTGPRSGIVQLWINALPEEASVGKTIEYVIEVTDDSRVDALTNVLLLRVLAKGSQGGGSGSRSETGNKGKGKLGGSDQLALPPIVPVSSKEWEKYDFDANTALRVKLADTANDSDDASVYDFYVNVDNRYLKATQKETKTDANLLEKQFVYGMVLIGLALLQQQKVDAKRRRDAASEDGGAQEGVERRVDLVTKGLAPIFLPMVDAIGGLSVESES
jgi:hypothetical protein